VALVARGSQIRQRVSATLILLQNVVDVWGADDQQPAKLADALVAGDDG